MEEVGAPLLWTECPGSAMRVQVELGQGLHLLRYSHPDKHQRMYHENQHPGGRGLGGPHIHVVTCLTLGLTR